MLEKYDVADELAYRLQWLKYFSFTQLTNYIISLNNPQVEKEFYKYFWLGVINFLTNEGYSNSVMNNFYKLALNVPANAPKDTFEKFLARINECFYEMDGTIDGLAIKEFRTVLSKSSSLGEIRQIGTKHGVNVPKRLSKEEYIDRIIEELKTRNAYKPEHTDQLKGMVLVELSRFAKDNNISVSPDLSKNASIDYILMNYPNTKEACRDTNADTFNLLKKELELSRSNEPYYVVMDEVDKLLDIPEKAEIEKGNKPAPKPVPQPAPVIIYQPAPQPAPAPVVEEKKPVQPLVTPEPVQEKPRIQQPEPVYEQRSREGLPVLDVRNDDAKRKPPVPVDGILIQNTVEVKNDDILSQINNLKLKIDSLVEIITSGELQANSKSELDPDLKGAIYETRYRMREIMLGRRKAQNYAVANATVRENNVPGELSFVWAILRFFLSFVPWIVIAALWGTIIYMAVTSFIDAAFVTNIQGTVDNFINQFKIIKFDGEYRGVFEVIRKLLEKINIKDAGVPAVETTPPAEGAASLIKVIILGLKSYF
jgi:hypothetical protein